MPHLQPAAAESLVEGWHQFLVEFKGENTVKTLEQGLRQRAMSRSNLENPRRLFSQRDRYPLGNRSIDQEVLAEAATFGPTHPAHSEF